MMSKNSKKKKCSIMPGILIKHMSEYLNRIRKEEPCMTDNVIVPEGDYSQVSILCHSLRLSFSLYPLKWVGMGKDIIVIAN